MILVELARRGKAQKDHTASRTEKQRWALTSGRATADAMRRPHLVPWRVSRKAMQVCPEQTGLPQLVCKETRTEVEGETMRVCQMK